MSTLFHGIRVAAIIWLLLVGLWSGPSIGATLVYPNGLLIVEVLLLLSLLVLARSGEVVSPRRYPFLWPCLGVLALCALTAGMRVWQRGLAFDGLGLWRTSEPMLRGALLYLAIAGQPALQRIAWRSGLAGLLLLIGACVLQHLTGVSRWYPDLDQGWAGGFVCITGNRVQGLTSYINLTAAMVAASVACWWGPVVLLSARYRLRLALLAGGILAMAALWYTGSRGPLLAILLGACILLTGWYARAWGLYALAATALFLLTIWPREPRWALVCLLLATSLAVLAMLVWQKNRRLLMLTALVLGLAGGLPALDYYGLHLSLEKRFLEQGLGDQARKIINHQSLLDIKESPWWGIGDAEVGARVFHIPHPDLQTLPRTQQNAHNQYLHWAAAEGVPTALALVLLVWWGAAWCLPRARYWPAVPRAVGLSVAGALITFLLANLTDAHFWRIEGGGFFWSLLSMGVACDTWRATVDPPPVTPPASPARPQ